jgi:Excalibur calcium-binding domain
MRHEPPASRRQLRAAHTRARALSPARIVVLFLSFPLLASAVATSLYIRVSPYDPTTALAHLIARFGCDAATYVDLAPAYRGEIGYHARNDTDGNGVTCEASSELTTATTLDATVPVTAEPAGDAPVRMISGAKFVKP